MAGRKYTSTQRPVDTLTGTVANSGVTQILPAPGVGLCWAFTYMKVQIEGSTEAVVLLKSGSNIKQRVYSSQKGDGTITGIDTLNPLKLNENEALNLDLSVGQTVNYEFHYRKDLP